MNHMHKARTYFSYTEQWKTKYKESDIVAPVIIDARNQANVAEVLQIAAKE